MAEGIEGKWDSSYSSCPSDQFVCGMQVRNEDTAADNTALNGVEVRCCDKKIWANTSVVKIQEGEFGKWKNLVTCPSDYYYSAFKNRGSGSEIRNFWTFEKILNIAQARTASQLGNFEKFDFWPKILLRM